MRFGVIVALAALAACERVGPDDRSPVVGTADAFEVHLQTWFDQTPVRVELDGDVILDDTISTGAVLAYAAIIERDVPQGSHMLRVVVDHGVDHRVVADTTLDVTDTMYVAVNYSTDPQRIQFATQRSAFPYR